MKLMLLTIVGLILTASLNLNALSVDSINESPLVNVAEEDSKVKPTHGAVYYITAITIGFALALAAMFGALGQSKAIAASVESIARQPEAGGRIFLSMIIGLALIETLVIYTLVICFMLIGKLA